MRTMDLSFSPGPRTVIPGVYTRTVKSRLSPVCGAGTANGTWECTMHEQSHEMHVVDGLNDERES